MESQASQKIQIWSMGRLARVQDSPRPGLNDFDRTHRRPLPNVSW